MVEVENTWTEVNYINRCDSTLTSTPREGGCTFNDIVPELALDKTDARYGLHAQFVENAQASTPDHCGSRALGGDPLQRLTDEERTDDNRAESCRGFVKQFADDSCDEYPHAATYQGAAEIGRARTAVGHVPETHNERGGSMLSRFLLANRVIDGDKYWVTPVDGPGGGGPERDTPPTVNAGADVSTSEGSLVQLTGSVTDDDGDSEQWSTMVVVYDPAAGTVAGNGWLAAPGDGGFDFAGSYPTSTARIPDGAVTFALPVSADLNLRTHQQLEWLVVTRDGKIAIKGTAERLDGRKVGFVLYAYDGCPAGQTQGCQSGADRLRVVVWDVDRHGPIPEGVPAIHDNRGSSPFDIDVANPQQINSGVIHIQRPAS